MGRRRRKRRKSRKAPVMLLLSVWILVMVVCALNWRKLGEAERTDAYMEKYRQERREEKEKEKEREREEEEARSPKKAAKDEGETKDARKEDILLVNKKHPLDAEYEPDLVWLDERVGRIAREAYQPAMDFLHAAQDAGYDIVVASAYRGYEYQENLVQEDVAALMRRGYSEKDAYEEVYRETMPPGCSEHQTGLAMDLVGRDYQFLAANQEDTASNRWLREHCTEYGFILRYPKEKEDVTCISYEPWHFRYVGKRLAEKITRQGVTLEEYLGE